jgi:hypothetical protein
MRLLEQLLAGLGVDRGLAAAVESPDLKLDRCVQVCVLYQLLRSALVVAKVCRNTLHDPVIDT